MAKTINRIGIVFLALVVSLLVVVGSVFVVNVTSNEDMLLADTSNTATGGNGSGIENNYNSGERAEIPEIPTAESEYILTCSCASGTPCTCGGMANIWNDAVKKSINTGKNVKVTLAKDWIAKVDGDSTTFGSGIGFDVARIYVSNEAEITLDLNGHAINRNLTKATTSSSGSTIFIAGGTLNLYDSKYDYDAVIKCYNDNKANESTLVEKLKALPVGKITGGWTPGNGGGILLYTQDGYSSYLNVYNGLFVGNKSNNGGGIYGYPNTYVNIYDGIFACNEANYGGAICENRSNFEILKVHMFGNIATGTAGAIYLTGAKLNLDNYDIFDNKAISGGAMYIVANSVANIYSGKIHNNELTKTAQNSAAIGCNNSILNIYGADIYENTGDYGTIFVCTGGAVNMYDGKIHDNSVENSGGIDCNNANFNMYGGEIYNNTASNYGSFMFLLGINGSAKIYGGKIYNNHCALTTNGAVYIASTAQFSVGAGAQIYGNTAGADKHPADVILTGEHKIGVLERLISANQSAHIGVTLRSDFAFNTFTDNYSLYNKNINPAFYFFISNSTEGLKILDGEVAVDSTLTKPTQKIEWYWSDTDKTTETNITLPYKGSDYIIKSSLGDFTRANVGQATQFAIKDVGKYAFHITNTNVNSPMDYINPSFTVTILPKEVDLVWTKTLTYNGVLQSPKVEVKQGSLFAGDTCTVTVSGSAKNVGTGYSAKATGLSNSNYKINSFTNSTFFSIAPANLTINIATNNKTIDYTGQSAVLDDWYEFTHNAVGFEANKNIEALFDVDKSALVPQYTKDGVTTESAVNVGEYDIAVKPFDASKVFTGNSNYNVTIEYVDGGKLTIVASNVVRTTIESGYDYLVLENEKRVSYKDKGMIHGVDDSNVNIANGNAQYVIGNIMPETTVQTLLEGLVCDTSIVEVYNKQGNSADDNAVVGTGWYIEYAGEKIYLSVLGDVTGDGRIDATDITYLRRIANGEVSDLSIAVQLAAMVDNRGGVTSVDAEILRAVCKYETTIDRYF